MKTRLSVEDDNHLALNMVETIHHHKQPPQVHGGGSGGETGGGTRQLEPEAEPETETETETETEPEAELGGVFGFLGSSTKTYWALMCASGAALVVGLSSASLLGRLYFLKGGSSRWLYTWIQSAAWPLLLPLLLLIYAFSGQSRGCSNGSGSGIGSDRSRPSSSSSSSASSLRTIGSGSGSDRSRLSSAASSSASSLRTIGSGSRSDRSRLSSASSLRTIGSGSGSDRSRLSSAASASSASSASASLRTIGSAIAALGCLTALDNLLYSWGASYLPVSTNSLLCASQLAFNAAFSAALLRHRLSAFTLNSIFLITIATLLVAVSSSSSNSAGESQQGDGSSHGDGDGNKATTKRDQYVAGIAATVMASAIFALILPLTELIYRDLVGRSSFARVIEVQLGVSAAASAVSLAGIWASGDFSAIAREAAAFGSGTSFSGATLNLSTGNLSMINLSTGNLSIGNLSTSGNLSTPGTLYYVGTLVGCSVGWQLYVLGAAGIVFLASSLVSCVFMTAMIPVLPALAVVAFSDPFSPLDALAMLLSLWGFLSYLYGGYLLQSKSKSKSKSKSGHRHAKHVSSLEHLPPA